MVTIPFEKLMSLSLGDVIGRADLGRTRLASAAELAALEGDPGEGVVRGTIQNWRGIAIEIEGQPTAVVLLGTVGQEYWGTSPVMILTQAGGRARTRSGSLYLLEDAGPGEPPLEHILHLCRMLWAWGEGRILQVPEVFYMPAPRDPLAPARERARTLRAQALSSPDVLSLFAFSALLGILEVSVLARSDRGEILRLVGDAGQIGFPRWQVLEDGGLLPGLESLHRIVTGGPWMIYFFLLARDPFLNRSPLDALRDGQLDRVHRAARIMMGDK